MNVVEKLISRVKLMIVKSLVDTINDTTEIQLVKIDGFDGDVNDGIERFQNYGFTSNPPAGESEAIVANLGGDQSHPVVLVQDSGAYRKKDLENGETAHYHKSGSYILMKDNTIFENT